MTKAKTSTPALASVPSTTAAPAVLCAQETLRRAAQAITDHEALDNAHGRSMTAAVAAFNAMEKTTLTERQGWAFLQTVHMTRAAATARNGLAPNASDMQAAAAYAALASEAADNGRG